MRRGHGWSACEVTAAILHGRWVTAQEVSSRGSIQSISNALRHAYQNGMVERRREGGRRSRYLWHITVAGRTLVNRLNPGVPRS